MPVVKIEDIGPRSAGEKAQLVALLFDALKATLGVSDGELQARYTSLEPGDFIAPPGPGDYLSIEISLFAGRSLDAKRRLYKRVASDVSQLLRIDPVRVLILLREEPLANWGMHGGRAAIDIEFDYPIDV